MKKIIAATFVAALSLGVVSCSDEDTDAQESREDGQSVIYKTDKDGNQTPFYGELINFEGKIVEMSAKEAAAGGDLPEGVSESDTFVVFKLDEPREVTGRKGDEEKHTEEVEYLAFTDDAWRQYVGEEYQLPVPDDEIGFPDDDDKTLPVGIPRLYPKDDE